MAQLSPYLRFTGNCREAMTFYQRCLGGDLTMMTFGESPMAEQMPAELQDKVLHSMLSANGLILMGSDQMPGTTVQQGGPVTLALTSSDKEEVRAAFAKLAEGGTIAMPLDEAFFGLYGEVVDRFGMHWMFQAN